MSSLEEGFLSGCDDYIRKPFEIKELLLRVQTLIKKEFSNKNEVVEISPNVTFNTISNELKSNNEEIKLNLKELKLLKFFFKIQMNYSLTIEFMILFGIMMKSIVITL